MGLFDGTPSGAVADVPPLLAGRRIAVARDAAFSFIHSALESPMTSAFTGWRRSDGQPGEPCYRLGSVRASDLHLYFPSAPEAVAALFVP